MATVRPFRGVRFSPERVELSLVLAPSGAFVDEQEESAALAREPRNAVRALSRRGTSAALHLAEWRRARVLVADDYPSLYAVRATRDDGGAEAVGFFGALVLERGLESGVKLARDVDEARVARLSRQLESAGLAVEPIVARFADDGGRVERAVLGELDEREPDVRAQVDGASYELWVIDDETTTARVSRHLEDKALDVTDGGELLFAALALEHARRAQASAAQERAPLSVGVFFVVGDDDGMWRTPPPAGLVLAPLVALSDDGG